MEGLLRASDVVSLHCPLNAATQGLIGREELGLMRADAVRTCVCAAWAFMCA